jgi:hypothetical protein
MHPKVLTIIYNFLIIVSGNTDIAGFDMLMKLKEVLVTHGLKISEFTSQFRALILQQSEVAFNILGTFFSGPNGNDT